MSINMTRSFGIELELEYGFPLAIIAAIRTVLVGLQLFINFREFYFFSEFLSTHASTVALWLAYEFLLNIIIC
ncbi:hypothetical protein L5515_009729 [Caenorhabditis briggsae]|uniref:Uncharacterized protein n=1 Tax=Caenorhabditis briggsae TaxID=6238 RepID=A0AAE9JPA3_CAEBR|nr:hypothetical protein L5515_009729 [Caenorhabditis briggsae]